MVPGSDDRHVAKTDDIKDFVITEESSIAKGIRRIVAVTGHDAHEISRKAGEFEKKLEQIESLQGKEKEAAMKPYLLVSITTLAITSSTYQIGARSERSLFDQEAPASREV